MAINIMLFSRAWGMGHASPGKKALKIARKNARILDSTSQLLVVFNAKAGENKSSLVALEKFGKEWKVFITSEAGIGRNGFADPGKKREGDSKSPTGLFKFGQLFGYESNIDTQMPHQQTAVDDKWIDDPESPDYNKYIKGNTTAKSFENLRINSDEYKLCMVIEYNMHPVVKGMGSAIFMHLSMGDSVNSSSGCVVLTPSMMQQLLKWMKPEAKPSILMGTEKILMDGLK